MLKMITLNAAADRDIEAIRTWYLQISHRLARDFEEELGAAFGRILSSPESHPVFHRDYRRAMLHQFKYLVFFRIKDDKAIVSLVTHQKRSPVHWQQRLQAH